MPCDDEGRRGYLKRRCEPTDKFPGAAWGEVDGVECGWHMCETMMYPGIDGTIGYNETRAMESAFMACGESYVAEGKPRECDRFGRWGPDTMVCRPLICPAEDVWNETPANERQTLPCPGTQTGVIVRECSDRGIWNKAVSHCLQDVCTDSTSIFTLADTGFNLYCDELYEEECDYQVAKDKCPVFCNLCKQTVCVDSREKFLVPPTYHEFVLCDELYPEECDFKDVQAKCPHSCDKCPDDSNNYRVDQWVSANWYGYGWFYPARVSRVHADGRYDVEYFDNDKETKVPHKRIRPLNYRLCDCERAVVGYMLVACSVDASPEQCLEVADGKCYPGETICIL